MRTTTVVAAVACLLAWAAPARAQTANAEDTAAARAAFADGTARADRGDWAGAVDRFRRSLALHPSAATHYNLGGALLHLGHMVEAAEELRAVLRDARPTDRAYGAAQELLHQIEPRIGRLLIRVTGDPAGAQVTLDGRTISDARIGLDSPADPGRHRVVLAIGGRETAREVDVPEGRSVEVELSLASAAVAVVPAPPPPVAPQTPPAAPAGGLERPATGLGPESPARAESSGGSVTGKWWFWTGLGVVVVGGSIAAFAIATSGNGGPQLTIAPGNSNPGTLRFP